MPGESFWDSACGVGAVWIVLFGSAICYGVYQWLHEGDNFNVTTSSGQVVPQWAAYAIAAVVPALGVIPLIVGLKLVMGGRRKP